MSYHSSGSSSSSSSTSSGSTYTSSTSTSSGSTGGGTPTSGSGSSGVTNIVNNRFSDLNLQMIPHPQKRDIIPVTGVFAVKNAIKTLLLTNFMERPFQLSAGANLRNLLFEPADAITRLALKDSVLTVLERHEPRIENINVIVQNTSDESAYIITVIFTIKENDSVEDVEINLRRLR